MRALSFPLLVSAAMAAAIALLAWRRRRVRGASPFALLMLAVAEWTVTYVFELESNSLASKVSWVMAQYVGIVLVPVAWFAFALEYTGREQRLTRRNVLLLCFVPLVTLVLVWTNPFHHLMMEDVRLMRAGPYAFLRIARGPAFWLHLVYAYALLLWGGFLILREHVRGGPVYRRQTRLLLVAAAIPWLGNLVYVLNWGMLPYVDITSFLFVVSGVIIFWALFRLQFLRLVPVARDTVIDNMRDGVLVVDALDRVADLNPAAERMLGVSSSQAIGGSAKDVLAKWPELVGCLSEASSNQQVEIGIDECGTSYAYELTISPLWRTQLGFEGRVITFRDVTERREAQLALQQRAAELQSRNKELDAFAHTVAHDLKAPLTTIVGYAEVLKDFELGPSSEDVEDLLEEIAGSGRAMGSIVDALLLLASVRQADQVKQEPLDMAVVVQESLRRVRGLIDRHEAEIVCPESWPSAMGYRPWIEEVWVNYVVNAIKHGGRPPHVTLGATSREAGKVCFWVRDNGPGLSNEDREQLFVPFTQLGGRALEGYGLGLSIVRRILDKLGGKVVVESELGKGSLFGFVLERAELRRAAAE